jgi:hypothetical protein
MKKSRRYRWDFLFIKILADGRRQTANIRDAALYQLYQLRQRYQPASSWLTGQLINWLT